MPSKVSLMNRALRLVSARPLSSPADTSVSAEVVGGAWADVLESVLADHAWAHATRWAALAELDTPPPFGPGHAYRLPPEALRLIDVRQSGDMTAEGASCYVAGRDVYTAISPCYARFVVLHDNPSHWPGYFCEAFVLRLAAEIAPTLATDSGLGLKLREMYLRQLEMARLSDTSQMKADKINQEATCSLLQARG